VHSLWLKWRVVFGVRIDADEGSELGAVLQTAQARWPVP
jgi:hypothetical protein